MNNRAFTISFIVAILAVTMVYSYVTSTEESYRLKYGVEMGVVVASKNIKELDVLDETNLTTKNTPKDFLQPGSSNQIKDFLGGLAIAPILSGEQVTRSKVTQLGARTGLARQIAPGKRAVTINVNDQTGIARLLKPGDRVDVLANLDIGNGNKFAIEVRTILQDVLVLATGKYVTNTIPGILEVDPFKGDTKNKVKLSEYTNFANITLEVDPFDAQKLVFANMNLALYLTLRNNDDNMKDVMVKTMLTDFIGKEGAAAAQQKVNDMKNSANPGKR